MKRTVRVKFKGQAVSVRPIKVPQYADPLEVGFYLARELKRTNPVDTGKSRRAWTVQGHKNGNVTVYNKVNYIQYLEKGHSKQAPNGFVEQAISKTRKWQRTLNPDDEPKFDFTGKSVDRLLESKTIQILANRSKLEEVTKTITPALSTSDEVVAKLINTLIEEGRQRNTIPVQIKRQITDLLLTLGIING